MWFLFNIIVQICINPRKTKHVVISLCSFFRNDIDNAFVLSRHLSKVFICLWFGTFFRKKTQSWRTKPFWDLALWLGQEKQIKLWLMISHLGCSTRWLQQYAFYRELWSVRLSLLVSNWLSQNWNLMLL